MIRYELVDSDFSLLQFKDGKEEHRPPSKTGIQLVWGLEATLKRDLSDYYYFSVNRMNIDKRVVPGKAYVNGVEAESIQKLEGEYLIRRDAVEEPLRIRVESVPALMVRLRGIEQFPILGQAGQKVVVSLNANELDDLCGENYRPVFLARRQGSEEIIALKKFQFTHNPILPWLSFIMPPFDVEIEVKREIDDRKAVLTVDPKGLGEYLVDGDGIVSEALYSDDYDFGIEDHEFYEKRIRFPKGRRLKVEFRLKEKKEVVCLLNDKAYSPVRIQELSYHKGKEKVTYEYRFEVVFVKEGILSFRIED